MARKNSKNNDNIISEIFRDKFKRFMPFYNDNRPSMYGFSNKKTKTYLTRNETLQLKGNINIKIAEIKAKAKEIFKQHYKNPDEILEIIKAQGTPVIKAQHIEKVLFWIGEKEGFILPLNGFRALFLTIMINILSKNKIAIGFNTPAMFVMRDLPVNFYFFAHQFHHWLSYTGGLGGYDNKTTLNFKSIFHPEFGRSDIRGMSIDEIFALKEAIARDKEAIQFVKDISRELIGSENSVKKLRNGESLNL